MNTTSKHAERIAYYCGLSRAELMQKMDFYTLNELGGYLGVRLRGARILAVAHIDFLGSGSVHKVTEGIVVSSALDDRLGVYAAMEALPAMGVECDVLLCDDEESANSSMQSVGMDFLSRYNWIIELDCSGVRAVTYGYKSMAGVLPTVWSNVSMGAFSDITSVEHACPVGAFNAGVGYHMQHSEHCYVKIPEFVTAMGRVKKFYEMFKDVRFEEAQAQENMELGVVVENKAYYTNWTTYHSKSTSSMDHDDDDDHWRDRLTRYTDYPSEYSDDPADKYITSPRGRCLLDGDQAPINDGHSELEVCEMCSRILLNDEVFLYQGWPVCEEHYYMLTADEVDEDGNLVPADADEWENGDD